MINNPEFRKNLWLEFSLHRVLIGMLVLGLIFAYFYIADDNSDIKDVFMAALGTGIILCALWGTKAAVDSVADELRERTWPFIKLSSISPLKLMLGKIFGATSYIWFLTFICIFIGYITYPLSSAEGYNEFAHLDKNLFFIFCILLGITCHVAAYLITIKSINNQKTQQKINSLVITLVIAAVAGSFFMELDELSRYNDPNAYNKSDIPNITWYGFSSITVQFLIFKTFLLLAWALIGSYNLTKAELGYKISNLPWIVFLLFVVFYAYGFLKNYTDYDPLHGLEFFPLAAFIYIILYYALLLVEKKDIVTIRKMNQLMPQRGFLGLNSAFPMWYVTFGFVLLALIGSIISLPEYILVTLSVIFLVVRDSAIIFDFSVRGTRRGEVTSVVYLVLLYTLLPLLASAISGQNAEILFLPTEDANIYSLAFMATQAGIAGFFAIKRIRPMLAFTPKL